MALIIEQGEVNNGGHVLSKPLFLHGGYWLNNDIHVFYSAEF